MLFHKVGRGAAFETVEPLLAREERVIAADLFYFGECAIAQRAWLWALLVATVGDRSLGVQASELATVVQWRHREFGGPVRLLTAGSRAGVSSLATAGLLDLTGIVHHQPLAGLKQVLEENRTFDQSQELFCFESRKEIDAPQLAALAVTTPLTIIGGDKPKDRIGSSPPPELNGQAAGVRRIVSAVGDPSVR